MFGFQPIAFNGTPPVTPPGGGWGTYAIVNTSITFDGSGLGVGGFGVQAGAAVGDLIVIARITMNAEGAPTITNTAGYGAGWTISYTDAGNGFALILCYKVATAGDAAGGGIDLSSATHGFVESITIHRKGTPFDGSIAAGVSFAANNIAPSISPAAQALGLVACISDLDAQLFTGVDNGFVIEGAEQEFNDAYTGKGAIASKLLAAGASGATTFGLASGTRAAFSVAFT